jgi:hypothetical protein
MAALGSLFLVLSPRLFADFFYNSKDAVFMAAFAIAMSTSVRFLLRPTATSAFLHAVATGIAIDVRVVGIVLPAATAAFFLLRLARAEVPRPTVSTLALYLGLTAGTVVALWPYLWAAPWSNFVEAVENMSRFRWKERVLYQGALVAASDLPWHYVPVWIAISTPIPYLVLFVAGTMAILAQLVRRRWRLRQNETELQDLLFLSLAMVPVASVIVLNSVLYDGWRQLYFIYPAFVLVSLRGWVRCSAGVPGSCGAAGSASWRSGPPSPWPTLDTGWHERTRTRTSTSTRWPGRTRRCDSMPTTGG